MNYLVEARKTIAALSGAAAEAVSLGLLSGTAEKWTTGILAVLTAGIVYLIPNGDKEEVSPGGNLTPTAR